MSFFQVNMIHQFHLGAIVIVRPPSQRGRKVLQEMSWFKDIRQIWLLQNSEDCGSKMSKVEELSVLVTFFCLATS